MILLIAQFDFLYADISHKQDGFSAAFTFATNVSPKRNKKSKKFKRGFTSAPSGTRNATKSVNGGRYHNYPDKIALRPIARRIDGLFAKAGKARSKFISRLRTHISVTKMLL